MPAVRMATHISDCPLLGHRRRCQHSATATEDAATITEMTWLFRPWGPAGLHSITTGSNPRVTTRAEMRRLVPDWRPWAARLAVMKK